MRRRRGARRPFAGALLVLLAAGCAEMKRPAPAPPPADLVAGAPAPERAAVAAAAAAFSDRGPDLSGRPAALAQAAAQLEYATQAFASDPQWAVLAVGVPRELLLAREEVRDAIGLDNSASSEAAVLALLRAARALRAGDRARAGAALSPPLFRPGGEASIARLADPGPLPQAARATALAQGALARLEVEGLLGSTQIRERSIGGEAIGFPREPAGY